MLGIWKGQPVGFFFFFFVPEMFVGVLKVKPTAVDL
jgi:hypothetical protein